MLADPRRPLTLPTGGNIGPIMAERQAIRAGAIRFSGIKCHLSIVRPLWKPTHSIYARILTANDEQTTLANTGPAQHSYFPLGEETTPTATRAARTPCASG